MTTDELKKEAEEYAREWLYHVKDLELHHKEDYKPEYIRIKEAYLAGAEPREKRIAELEHQLIHRNCLDCSNHSSKLRMRTLELEKENAELKAFKEKQNQDILILKGLTERQREENAELKKRVRKQSDELYNRFAETEFHKENNERHYKQLIEAKELLKNLLDVAKFYNKHRDKGAIMDITPIYDAEQFLKESEVEK